MIKNINCLGKIRIQLSRVSLLLASVLIGTLLPPFLSAMPGPDTIPVSANAYQFATYMQPREDTKNNVWVLNFAFHPGVNLKYLSEFDGKKWRGYPLPDHTAVGINSSIALDDAGNVWVMSSGSGPGDTSLVGVFDHAHKSWRGYDTLENALVGEKSRRPKTITLGRFFIKAPYD